MNPTIKKHNQTKIQKDIKCQQLIDEMKAIEKFICSFGFLSFGRDYILCKNWSFSLQGIITSVELTAGNIITCCEYGCMADANSLLRKYRDDLFFYLYIVVFDSNQKPEITYNATEMEDNISQWIQNGLNSLYIQDVLKAVGTSPQLKKAVTAYKLQKSFNGIGERLNNFVHGNGFAYYNRNINAYKADELQYNMKILVNDMKYITVTFLILLILCSPLSVMSTDYIDYLDCGDTPPEDSQYWVAPFVEHFILNNINLIDENCYNYLKENTSMQF
ncbi:hypothetical protein [Anaerovorax sp. IOR16]|uniref:hypothetical protein n=1 Tax=Anaerovorax sp. IOR16 TaxID=2773458 RepID=UPI0019D23677|nr:hypothetical protein [Anaerovorax sp. IOR16]